MAVYLNQIFPIQYQIRRYHLELQGLHRAMPHPVGPPPKLLDFHSMTEFQRVNHLNANLLSRRLNGRP